VCAGNPKVQGEKAVRAYFKEAARNRGCRRQVVFRVDLLRRSGFTAHRLIGWTNARSIDLRMTKMTNENDVTYLKPVEAAPRLGSKTPFIVLIAPFTRYG
jgi:hypothetical protein